MGNFNIDTIFQQYLWPFFAFGFIGVLLYGITRNFKALSGSDGESRKEGLIDLAWLIGYALAAIGVITAVVAAIRAFKPSLS
ncbi:MAG: hypothetical protein ACTHXT_09865 [Sphingobacterium sp.]|uniref:hypothetical protein n=1 Tax=Sphingobacterium sp. JB170 TaxID=1434842 RepID=UPI00097F2410|nr:hypothetical protein [Sphingobacterium sp. JB170]SJN26920.1 hypothetical protein FM107_05135 [Sphingobacterium sp. JB170]